LVLERRHRGAGEVDQMPARDELAQLGGTIAGRRRTPDRGAPAVLAAREDQFTVVREDRETGELRGFVDAFEHAFPALMGDVHQPKRFRAVKEEVAAVVADTEPIDVAGAAFLREIELPAVLAEAPDADGRIARRRDEFRLRREGQRGDLAEMVLRELVFLVSGLDFPEGDVSRVSRGAGLTIGREGNRGDDTLVSALELANGRVAALRVGEVPESGLAVFGARQAVMLGRAARRAGDRTNGNLVCEDGRLVIAATVPDASSAVVADAYDVRPRLIVADRDGVNGLRMEAFAEAWRLLDGRLDGHGHFTPQAAGISLRDHCFGAQRIGRLNL